MYDFPPDCFEENIRYVGPSVLNESFTLAPDANVCNRLCWKMVNICFYFAFNPQNNQCFLMGQNAIGRRVSSAYWVSGPPACVRPRAGW